MSIALWRLNTPSTSTSLFLIFVLKNEQRFKATSFGRSRRNFEKFFEQRIKKYKNLPSAVAVALAIGRARWGTAILHNKLIVQGVAYPTGLHYNGLLCNIAWEWFLCWIQALVFWRWVNSSLL